MVNVSCLVKSPEEDRCGCSEEEKVKRKVLSALRCLTDSDMIDQ